MSDATQPVSEWCQATPAESEAIRQVVEGLRFVLVGQDSSVGVSGLVIILAELTRSLRIPIDDIADRAVFIRQQLDEKGTPYLFEAVPSETANRVVARASNQVH